MSWDLTDIGLLIFLISISVISCDVVERGVVIENDGTRTTIQLGSGEAS